jgi:hypothetical protein
MRGTADKKNRRKRKYYTTAWVFSECKGDIQQFCPQATYGNIADCMRPHLGEASDQCRGAIAFIASPAGD